MEHIVQFAIGIDENKDLIIDRAAEKLADSYKRTKAFKEKMASTMEEL